MMTMSKRVKGKKEGACCGTRLFYTVHQDSRNRRGLSAALISNLALP